MPVAGDREDRRSGHRSRERRPPTAPPRTGAPLGQQRRPRRHADAGRWPPRRSSALATRTCERPSYPPVVAFSRSGRPSVIRRRGREGRRSSEPRATARPRNPSARRSARSASRSWVISSGYAPGRTGSTESSAVTTDGVDVLELVGDDRAPFGEPQGRVHVAIAADDDQVGHDRRAGTTGPDRGQPPGTPSPRGLTEHPAELAAAQDPDGRRRLDGRRPTPSRRSTSLIQAAFRWV